MARRHCSGFEPFVADRIEVVMPMDEITSGRRECHDAQPGRRRVDWIYPDARPRQIALEVTSIVAPVDKRGERAADALGLRLSEVAEAEELGAWLVIVRSDRDLRRAAADIAKILRDAQPIRERLLATEGYIRPGSYTSDDLFRLRRGAWDAYIAEHGRLKSLGIEELKPI